MRSSISRKSLRAAMPSLLLAALLGASLAGPAFAQTRGSWNVDADGLWSLNTYQVVNVYTSRILTGTIAEPAYWNRALSAGEIAYLAALGFGR